jgi:hypothetical protein
MLTDTPAVLWAQDEGGGYEVIDLSGNGRNGTLIQGGNTNDDGGIGVRIASGAPPNSRRIRRASDAYLRRAYDAALDVGTGDFAVEAIIKSASVEAAAYREFVNRDTGSSGTGLLLRFDASGTNKLLVYTAGVQTIGEMQDTVARHLIVQRRAGNLEIYRNGVLVAGPTAWGANLNNGVRELRLGQCDGSQQTWDGNLLPFAYYTAALSPTRVAAHFAASGL